MTDRDEFEWKKLISNAQMNNFAEFNAVMS